jgi:hypothetical protein
VSFLGLLREGTGTPYLVLTDRGRARWALPADSPSVLQTAMSVHAPATPAGITRWHLARLVAGSGLGELLPGRRCRAEVPLAPALTEMLGVRDVRIGIAESFGGDRCVLLVIEPSGRARAFVKVTSSSEQIPRLEQESENLRGLNGVRGILDVPNPLYCGPMGEYWSLALTPIHGRTGLMTWKLDRKRVDAAAVIFGKKKGQSELAERLPSTVPGDTEWAERLLRVRSYLGDSAHRPVPLGFSHGDFAPWNVFVRGSRVGVLDWEAADRQGLPFWDLWHFAVSAMHVAPGAIALRTIREALHGRGSLMPLLRRYAHRTHVPIESARAVLILYLTLSGLHLLEEAAEGRRDQTVGLASRERLLDEALEVSR